MIPSRVKNYWTRFWMQFAGAGRGGRLATRFASWFVPGFMGRLQLADLNERGYISPNATIEHNNLFLGRHVFIGDRVVIYNPGDGGRVELADGVHLNGDIYLLTGQGGNVQIGIDTHLQPGSHLYAYKASIEIGRDVQIAPRCALYLLRPWDFARPIDL